MPLSPSLPEPNAPGNLAIISMSHWFQATISSVFGSFRRSTARSISSGRWSQASASVSSIVPSLSVRTLSCGSPPRSKARCLSSSVSRCPTIPSLSPSRCRVAISRLSLAGTTFAPTSAKFTLALPRILSASGDARADSTVFLENVPDAHFDNCTIVSNTATVQSAGTAIYARGSRTNILVARTVVRTCEPAAAVRMREKRRLANS